MRFPCSSNVWVTPMSEFFSTLRAIKNHVCFESHLWLNQLCVWKAIVYWGFHGSLYVINFKNARRLELLTCLSFVRPRLHGNIYLLLRYKEAHQDVILCFKKNDFNTVHNIWQYLAVICSFQKIPWEKFSHLVEIPTVFDAIELIWF